MVYTMDANNLSLLEKAEAVWKENITFSTYSNPVFSFSDRQDHINPLKASVAFIQKPVNRANQLTGFYMRATLALNELSYHFFDKESCAQLHFHVREICNKDDRVLFAAGLYRDENVVYKKVHTKDLTLFGIVSPAGSGLVFMK